MRVTEPRHSAHVRRLSTPRAAAVAGVLFALLFGIALALIRLSMPYEAASAEWTADASTKLRVAAILVPFAGIAFLWFIGVLRDGFGKLEDRFFSSVFIGSGILFLAMTFATAAVGVALITVHKNVAEPTAHDAVVTFGQAFMATLSKTYSLRMAAVFMMSLATMWLRTGLMPRWLVWSTYLGAGILLIASDISMWMTLAFPLWVLVVSLVVLQRAGVIDLHHDDD